MLTQISHKSYRCFTELQVHLLQEWQVWLRSGGRLTTDERNLGLFQIKSDLKKFQICPIWGRSAPLWRKPEICGVLPADTPEAETSAQTSASTCAHCSLSLCHLPRQLHCFLHYKVAQNAGYYPYDRPTYTELTRPCLLFQQMLFLIEESEEIFHD